LIIPIRASQLVTGPVGALRVGRGIGDAIYADDNIYGRAANISADVNRASILFTIMAGPFAGRFGARVTDTEVCPVNNKSLPEMVYDYNKHPELADNIWNAQQAGHPKILTHGGDSSVNRAAALNDIPKILSRDEYPFASSIEGGEGSWIGHVPVSQQNSQGAIIKNFIKSNNIKPGDQYKVRVINHPLEQ
jgi:hypothetical protein